MSIKNRGHSVLELVVSLVVLMVSILAIGTLSSMVSQASQRVRTIAQDVNDGQTILKAFLNDKTCTDNLAGVQPLDCTFDPVTGKVTAGGAPLRNIVVSSGPITEGPQTTGGTDFEPGAPGSLTTGAISDYGSLTLCRDTELPEYQANLIVSFGDSRANGGAGLAPIKIPVSATFDTEGRILDCGLTYANGRPLVCQPAATPTPSPAPEGCQLYTVPAGVTSLRIIAIGGGGGGSRTTEGCAYNMLSAAGGAAVEAIVSVTPGEVIPYCVGKGGRKPDGTGWKIDPRWCGDAFGGTGGDTYFGNYVRAGGGAAGNSWHYKNEDDRGTPPSDGGVFTTAPGVTVIRAGNGGSVAARGLCGGDAGFPLDAVNTGKGACDASAPAANYGGGGFGTGPSHYAAGDASAGGDGYILIEPK